MDSILSKIPSRNLEGILLGKWEKGEVINPVFRGGKNWKRLIPTCESNV